MQEEVLSYMLRFMTMDGRLHLEVSLDDQPDLARLPATAEFMRARVGRVAPRRYDLATEHNAWKIEICGACC